MERDALSRRKVLVRAASAALVVFVERTPIAAAADEAGALGRTGTRRAGAASQPRQVAAAFSGAPTKTVRVVRAADQLDVTLELFDVSLAGNQITITGAQPAIRMTFGSQHTVERMFQAVSPSVPTTSLPHIAAGDSVVVVPVTGTTPFTLDHVLQLAEASLTVQSTAGAPDGSATALEIPTGLAISPAAGTTMTASRTALTAGNTSELWLAKFRSGGDAVDAVAVANLSNTDLVSGRHPDTTERDRIVENTTGLDLGDAPFQAKRLWLSSSGAFARIDGDWPDATLIAWRQRIATGRDLHVELLTAGYLAPFGIRAAVSVIADRVWVNDTGGGQTSIMRLQQFLTLMEEEGTFSTRPYQANGGRGLPFTSVKATVDETASITLAQVNDLTATPINGVFDVNRFGSGSPLVVDYTATDRDGHEVSFTLPATFVDDDVAYNTGGAQAPAKYRAVFNGNGRNSFRDVDLKGQDLAFADPVAPGSGATTKKTYFFRFKLDATNGATSTDLETNHLPNFSAGMDRANVSDTLINASLGVPADSFEVTHHHRWLGPPEDNFDQAFLKLTTPKKGTVGAGGAPVTSVAAAEFTAEVFNQTAGIGPDSSSPTDPIDPDDTLGDHSKLLGTIDLRGLIGLIAPNLAVPGVDIPAATVTFDGDIVKTVFAFSPTLNTNEDVGFYAHPATNCKIEVTTVASLSGAKDTELTTVIDASNFDIHFPPVGTIVVVEFDRVAAKVATDGTFHVDPSIKSWKMHDDLSFLQPIMDLLKGLGGLDVSIVSEFIKLDYSLNFPSISLGMLRITNIHLDFGFGLPIGEHPVSLNAGLGSPGDPVEVKIGIFGGSFYLTVELSFGKDLANWKVAAGVSGFVEFGFDAIVVEAAVRLRIEVSFVFDKNANGETIKFTGSISLEGEIKVLGFLEVSAALVASVSYKTGDEVAVAKGEIQFGVDTPLGGVHGHVPLGAIEFELGDGVAEAEALAGPGRRPHGRAARTGPQAATVPSLSTFGDMYSPTDWTTYTGAFA